MSKDGAECSSEVDRWSAKPSYILSTYPTHAFTPLKRGQTKAGCCGRHLQWRYIVANGEESLQKFKMKLEDSETAHPLSPTAKQCAKISPSLN